jgi:hypothetical protein
MRWSRAFNQLTLSFPVPTLIPHAALGHFLLVPWDVSAIDAPEPAEIFEKHPCEVGDVLPGCAQFERSLTHSKSNGE